MRIPLSLGDCVVIGILVVVGARRAVPLLAGYVISICYAA